MKRLLIGLLLLLPILYLTSCKEKATEPKSSYDIYGSWVFKGHHDSITVMQKTSGLDSNNYGFIIYPDGNFLERKNAGWCGTPPISYANYSGHWKSKETNTLKIDVGYWGGQTSYIMQITTQNIRFDNTTIDRIVKNIEW
ncbi:MAG: hypothetical protein QME52_01130 [Bacteroidota bacterium]|nr:hypothetical protein [Bacteroidota bacterium]